MVPFKKQVPLLDKTVLFFQNKGRNTSIAKYIFEMNGNLLWYILEMIRSF